MLCVSETITTTQTHTHTHTHTYAHTHTCLIESEATAWDNWLAANAHRGKFSTQLPDIYLPTFSLSLHDDNLVRSWAPPIRESHAGSARSRSSTFRDLTDRHLVSPLGKSLNFPFNSHRRFSLSHLSHLSLLAFHLAQAHAHTHSLTHHNTLLLNSSLQRLNDDRRSVESVRTPQKVDPTGTYLEYHCWHLTRAKDEIGFARGNALGKKDKTMTASRACIGSRGLALKLSVASASNGFRWFRWPSL
ncbi:hypothetical protein F5B19DRAFT_274072 [Rostrohypoxylon terebratum]|nr:hypothetical protein F5B19DRAFT_274072 [Rostrohypoxylon terebratum]